MSLTISLENSMTENVIGKGMFELRENEEIWGLNRRFILFSNALLVNMLDKFQDLLGPVARRQIYEVGYSSGKIGGEKMRPIFKGGIEQYTQHVNLTKALGWGAIGEVKYDGTSGRIVIEYTNTWESGGYREVHGDKKTDGPICIFSTGLASGAAEGAFEIPYEGEEELCTCKGDPVCRFVMTPMGEKRKIIK
jgi:predicted hydrocarbon binding protein